MGNCVYRDHHPEQKPTGDLRLVAGLDQDLVAEQYRELQANGDYHINSDDSSTQFASIIANYKLLTEVRLTQNIRRTQTTASA